MLLPLYCTGCSTLQSHAALLSDVDLGNTTFLHVMPKQPLSHCYRAASPLEALRQPLQMYDVKISAGPNQPNGSLFLTLPLRSVLGAYGNPNYSSEPNCHTQPA